jgi:uncharacterized protein YukE
VSGPAPSNELETWFTSLPGIVQDVLHEPFTWMNDGLKMVAGNPQALVDAGGQYAALSVAVTQLRDEARADAETLARSWSGPAHAAFANHHSEMDRALETLAGQLDALPQLLQSGAQACVDGANMIVEIVVALLTAALSTLVMDAALALISAGASLAAGVAEVLAEAAESAAEVAQVIEKVAQALVKVQEILQKIAEALREVKLFFDTTKESLAEARAASKGLKGMDWVGAKVSASIQKTIVGKEIWAVTGGQVAIPGMVGPLRQAGGDYVEGFDAAKTAGQAADEAAG